MDRPRIKRMVIGLVILAGAYLVLLKIAVLLSIVALLGVAGFFGLRAWQRQQASAGGDP